MLNVKLYIFYNIKLLLSKFYCCFFLYIFAVSVQLGALGPVL